ncbi:MAG: hypothetical protein K9M49_03420 [Candidatus Marinimicrobia bacterium]|nr:hypothetical protein [Candidatus Neomarinimicrobiota bacterium]MCF7904184.1 hypothetical protein [Candidatus Neomarinimicrobiota bacterium]
MNQNALHYLPIFTTLLSVVFAYVILNRAKSRNNAPHLLWWGTGVILYGLGTFTESWITLLGWNPVIFKTWYIAGALFGGAPLAQGTIWFLLRPRTAKILTIIFLVFASVATVFIIASPINYEIVEKHLPNGDVFVWQWVRLFSPFINTYALIFLVGGAILSAYRFARVFRKSENLIALDRFMGNVLIAIGALLPGLGGIASRMGETQWLYLGELIGIVLIWIGFHLNIRRRDQQQLQS